MSIAAFRGTILHCLRDPGPEGDANAVECHEDGVLIIEDGRVDRIGPATSLLPALGPDVVQHDLRGSWLLPGFIDCHVHFPQTDIIAAYGTQLLDWLNTYTFPAEALLAEQAAADDMARFFIDELLRNGTTTALVFATVHAGSVDAVFTAAARMGMRLAAGKVLMDRHCPDDLRDTPETGDAESRALIERWHGQDRLSYAITPRFAPTSSPAQLQLAGQLAREFPDVLIQTHLAENTDEMDWVRDLFPDADSYLGVYRDAGLLRERAVFAHGIHLDDGDRASLASHDAAIAFCPTSNLFLGSGLFDLQSARAHGVRVGLGTDVGGGTSFSQLETASEAYKVLQLQGQSLHPYQALYLATLGGARALHLDDRIGNFTPGKEADFIVLDPASTPLLSRRMRNTRNLVDAAFVQLMLADDRAIRATYVAGEPRYSRPDH